MASCLPQVEIKPMCVDNSEQALSAFQKRSERIQSGQSVDDKEKQRG